MIQKLAIFFTWLDRWGICPRCKQFGLRDGCYRFRYEYCKKCAAAFWEDYRKQEYFEENFD